MAAAAAAIAKFHSRTVLLQHGGGKRSTSPSCLFKEWWSDIDDFDKEC